MKKNTGLLVLIIGAGPAGCAVAHGLKKKGIPFKIFDKGVDVHRNRHWAFTLGWSRPHLLELLPEAIGARLRVCQVDPAIDNAATGNDNIVMYNGQNRVPEYTLPIPNAAETNIRQLRMLLSKDLDVQYAKRFTHSEEENGGIRAYFDDGTSEWGTNMVGIDGAESGVRKMLLGNEGKMDILPFAMMNFTVSYTTEQALWIKNKLHPLVDIAVHPVSNHYIRTNVLDMPDQDDPSSWTFQILTTWPIKKVEDFDNEVDRLKRLKARVNEAGWAELYHNLIMWIPGETPILKDHLKIWRTRKFHNHNGKVTLVGDAAHAMTFHRGQGANNAFYDARCFVDTMARVQGGMELKEAIDAYDEKLIARGMEEVQISKSQTFYTHNWADFKNSPVIKLGTRPAWQKAQL